MLILSIILSKIQNYDLYQFFLETSLCNRLRFRFREIKCLKVIVVPYIHYRFKVAIVEIKRVLA